MDDVLCSIPWKGVSLKINLKRDVNRGNFLGDRRHNGWAIYLNEANESVTLTLNLSEPKQY